MVCLFRRTENNQAGTELSTWRPANTLFLETLRKRSAISSKKHSRTFTMARRPSRKRFKMRQEGGSKKPEGGGVALNFGYAA